MHAWDCRCGTRNAPPFGKCRRCGASRATGCPIPDNAAPFAALPPRPTPARQIGSAIASTCAASVQLILIVLGAVACIACPALALVIAFFWALFRIVNATESIARR